MGLTKVEILQKNKEIIVAQKAAMTLQYELQKDQADKRIAHIEAELLKATPKAE